MCGRMCVCAHACACSKNLRPYVQSGSSSVCAAMCERQHSSCFLWPAVHV